MVERSMYSSLGVGVLCDRVALAIARGTRSFNRMTPEDVRSLGMGRQYLAEALLGYQGMFRDLKVEPAMRCSETLTVLLPLIRRGEVTPDPDLPQDEVFPTLLTGFSSALERLSIGIQTPDDSKLLEEARALFRSLGRHHLSHVSASLLEHF